MARPVRVALAASLLLNVFLVGAIGGGRSCWRARAGCGGGAGRPVRGAGAELPQPDRRHFRQAILAVLRENRDLQQAAGASRRTAATLFDQPRFDLAAVTALLEQARTADFTLQARIDAAAAGVAATLPAEERVILARGLERGGPLRHAPP